jgi:hypothetical protein
MGREIDNLNVDKSLIGDNIDKEDLNSPVAIRKAKRYKKKE